MIWIGLAVGVVAVIAFVLLRAGGGGGGLGAGLRVGTLGWEAALTLDPLKKTIASRQAELASTVDEQRRDRLRRELAFLEAQVLELEVLVAARDASPGRGSIGFKQLPPD